MNSILRMMKVIIYKPCFGRVELTKEKVNELTWVLLKCDELPKVRIDHGLAKVRVDLFPADVVLFMDIWFYYFQTGFHFFFR